MSKKIGNIRLYSVDDLHAALGVNERTLRHWFNTGRLRGVKLGTQWHITEENLRRFLNADEPVRLVRTERPQRRLRVT